MTRLTLVAAVGANGVIGDGLSMPWHLPEDLKHFRRLTAGGVLLMGRRTFESIGGVLPGRRTVVLTRDAEWTAAGVEIVHSLGDALTVSGEAFVVGGGEIYRQTVGLASRLVVTEVPLCPSGSVTFPRIDPREWDLSSRLQHDGFAVAVFDSRNAR